MKFFLPSNFRIDIFILIPEFEHWTIVRFKLVILYGARSRPLIIIELKIENIRVKQLLHSKAFVHHIYQISLEEMCINMAILMNNHIVNH